MPKLPTLLYPYKILMMIIVSDQDESANDNNEKIVDGDTSMLKVLMTTMKILVMVI